MACVALGCSRTCGVYSEGDVPPVGGVQAGLTGALVHVAAALRLRLVARAGRAHAREAARRVAAHAARAQLQMHDTTTIFLRIVEIKLNIKLVESRCRFLTTILDLIVRNGQQETSKIQHKNARLCYRH